MTDTTVAEAAIGDFDGLAKGDRAPAWLADGVATRWELGPGVPEVTLITVSENATFLVRHAGIPSAVIRVSRPGYVPGTAHIESELHWVRALAGEVDTPVPSVIPGVDGDGVQIVGDGRGVGWFVVAFAFNPGQILEDDFTEPLPYYERIGSITAEFHLHARQWRPPAGFSRFSWELADMVGPAARWGDWHGAGLSRGEIRLLERAQSSALAVLAGLEKSPSTWGLIHADLRPSNIMLDGGVLTVIDFDDCGHARYLYDFASAFSFVEHLPVTPSLAQAWMRGYQETIPLSGAELSEATALSMIRRLQMLGWTTTHRADALPADIWQAQRPGTVEVARRYLADPLWLLSA